MPNAENPPEPPQMQSLTDEELLRYSRHILLPQLDIEGQQKLKSSHLMIVGLGGLGCPVALYLAASGVGSLSLADPDVVELSNLQRQIAYGDGDLGDTKVASAARQIQRLNPDVNISVYPEAASEHWLNEKLEDVDLLLDCTDNAQIRYDINCACLATKTPWISAAATGMNGQLIFFNPNEASSPCYACLYPDIDPSVAGCAESGVLSPLVGMIGSWQAAQAIKYLAMEPPAVVKTGLLSYWDIGSDDVGKLTFSQRKDCHTCQSSS
jgi:molybdopterin/thiamine biosynthesis adenylyltransferase